MKNVIVIGASGTLGTQFGAVLLSDLKAHGIAVEHLSIRTGGAIDVLAGEAGDLKGLTGSESAPAPLIRENTEDGSTVTNASLWDLLTRVNEKLGGVDVAREVPSLLSCLCNELGNINVRLEKALQGEKPAKPRAKKEGAADGAKTLAPDGAQTGGAAVPAQQQTQLNNDHMKLKTKETDTGASNGGNGPDGTMGNVGSEGAPATAGEPAPDGPAGEPGADSAEETSGDPATTETAE